MRDIHLNAAKVIHHIHQCLHIHLSLIHIYQTLQISCLFVQFHTNALLKMKKSEF